MHASTTIGEYRLGLCLINGKQRIADNGAGRDQHDPIWRWEVRRLRGDAAGKVAAELVAKFVVPAGEDAHAYREQAWLMLQSAATQQRPAPLEGGLLQKDWWRYWTDDPVNVADEWDAMVGSWDCNFKEGDTSDYVVGQVWARLGARFFLLDQVRGPSS